MKNRIKVPTKLRDELLLESGLRCPVPRCANEVALDIHHIDMDPGNNAKSNLLVLCAVHHRLAHEGKLSKNMCTTLKRLLEEESPFSKKTFVELKSRSQYLQTAIAQLLTTRVSYRAVYVGPLFLHPLWYYKRRDQLFSLPNYDIIVSRYLNKLPHSRQTENRVILRNSGRYNAKVDQIVPPAERSNFKKAVHTEITKLWGSKGNKGPLICCVDTGYLRIPLIHDNSFIVASRRTEAMQIEAGYLFTGIDDVRRERAMFDEVFDSSYRGQELEIEALRAFINQMWGNNKT